MNLINLVTLLKKVVIKLKCKHCGHALSNNSPICPHCGMLMSEEQLKRRKELNGYNNPYMQRLNKLNEERLKYKIEENEEHINIGAIIVIIAIVLIVILIAILLNG